MENYNAELEESRADWAMWQTEPSAKHDDNNDQYGSFLNDDYCDRLEQETHD